MTVRPTPRHHGAARAAARAPFAASLAAILLALLLCAFPLLSAHAEEPAKACPPGQVCDVVPTLPTGSVNPTPAPAPSETTPADPAPIIQEPAPAKPPVVTPAPVVRAPSPSATAEQAATVGPSPSSSMTPTPIRWTPSASATVDSAWTKPIDDGKEATQAALVSAKPSTGMGFFGILAIMAGVLLLGLGGLAFALWSRNRIGAH